MLGNLQDKIIQVCSPSLIIFYSVCQFIATHMFEYFVRPHICLSVSVDVAFYFKLGFGREGPGFESGSWFWGTVFFKMEFLLGVGWLYFDFLGDYFLLRVLFFY